MVLLTDNIYLVKYIEYFNNFIKQLKIIFQDDDENNINIILDDINILSDEEKVNCGNSFVSMLLEDKYFELFISNKIKLFSHKETETKNISESLFGEKLSLKKILNNQNEEIKTIIWTYLHTFYLLLQLSYSESNNNLYNVDRIKQINTLIKLDINGNNNNIKPIIESQIKKIIGSNINSETSNMINDIVSSFDNILNNSDGKNPFGGIFDISQKISDKYSDKINKGDIEIDKIMSSISTNIPGMDKIMDKLGNMENIVNQFKQNDSSQNEEKIVIDENFSTANIDIGVNNDDKKSDFKIGNILKMADYLGVIPGGNKSENNENNENNENKSELPDFSKIMNLMKKMNNNNSNEDLESIKNEMNSFYKNELGLDINKISEEIGLKLSTDEVQE